MIKKLNRLLGNIVGKVVRFVEQHKIEIYLAFIVLLIGLAVTLKPDNWQAIIVLFGVAIIGFIMMIKTVVSEARDMGKKEIAKERKESCERRERRAQFTALIQALEDIKNELKKGSGTKGDGK